MVGVRRLIATAVTDTRTIGAILSDMQPLAQTNPGCAAHPSSSPNASLNRRPEDIRFVRNRVLYARAALNAKGEVAFGLRHIRERFFPTPIRSRMLIVRKTFSADIQTLMILPTQHIS